MAGRRLVKEDDALSKNDANKIVIDFEDEEKGPLFQEYDTLSKEDKSEHEAEKDEIEKIRIVEDINSRNVQ